MAMELTFDFTGGDGQRQRRVFRNPLRTLIAGHPDDVPGLLEAADAALSTGLHVAGYVGYDAAPAFDAACRVRGGAGLPVLVLGVFGEPAIHPVPAPPPASSPQVPLRAGWRADIEPAMFVATVERIRAALRAGDAYQVNYTFRMHAALDGDPLAYYEQLRSAQDGGYCACLDFGEFCVLSASPELFFDWRDGILTTRPMKGTAPRGRWADEDDARAAALYESPKERAENLMIVDLLRNDLARLSSPGGVRVPRLFSIERYPTLFQMTSTVTARTRDRTGLADVFRALFPCGSITGAPKYKSMEIIAATESTPRGVYCGAIGFAGPAGATFNVAIRTVTVERATGAMVCGVGSGITWPSDAHAEYAEALIKAEFLTRSPARFELFETLLLENAAYLLRWRHMDRIRRSAAALGFHVDVAVHEALDAALYAYAAAHPSGRHRVRLRLAPDGAVGIEGVALGASDAPGLAVAWADRPVDRHDRLLYHKTTRRALYDGHLAAHPASFDVLLWNEDGEVTEFTRGNVLVEVDGLLATPPLACGLLPGTMRAELLARGEIVERVLHRREVERARRIWFVNSVRGRLEVALTAAPDTARDGRAAAPLTSVRRT